MKPPEKVRRLLPAVLQTIITLRLLLMLWLPFLPVLRSRPVQQVAYPEFIQAIRDGRVQAVQISSAEIRGVFRAGQNKAQPPQTVSAVRPPDLYDPELLPLLRS